MAESIIKVPDNISIKDRKFNFKIPSAWDGCAIFNMLAAYDMPFGISNVIGLKYSKRAMPADELETLMKLCLKNCEEDLPGGAAKVVDDNGEIGILDANAPLLTKIACQYINFFIQWWQAESN